MHAAPQAPLSIFAHTADPGVTHAVLNNAAVNAKELEHHLFAGSPEAGSC